MNPSPAVRLIRIQNFGREWTERWVTLQKTNFSPIINRSHRAFSDLPIAERPSSNTVSARRSAPIRLATSCADRGAGFRMVKRFNSAPERKIRLSIKFWNNLKSSSGLLQFIIYPSRPFNMPHNYLMVLKSNDQASVILYQTRSDLIKTSLKCFLQNYNS